MDADERAQARAILAGEGIATASLVTSVDPTEDVILLTPADYERVDADTITRHLMAALPGRKVWVAPNSPQWTSDPL